MKDASTIDGTATCGTCKGSLRSGRYVQALGSSLNTFCSEKCFGAAVGQQRTKRRAALLRSAKRLTIGLTFVGAWLTPHQGYRAPTVQYAKVQPTNNPGPAALPQGWFGPDWPPTETSLLAALGRDAWIHPLAGPVRRMPRNDTRVFGANRPGNRAVECRNGHCGVDLGGEIWGEHVRAVHDGVVDYVKAGSSDEHGGRFVRLSHRNGTVFTQYFHLAAIPRGLERGMPVKGGDVIGLLGDSGVKDSPPHLHFTISVRPLKDGPEKYMDPEPLVALWALRVQLEGSEVGLVTTVAEPGVPLGSVPLNPARKRKLAKLAKQKRASDESGQTEASGSAKKKASPAEDESTSETTPEPSVEE